MRTTVHELLRAKARITVECVNCTHKGIVQPYLLRGIVGQYGDVMKVKWRCTICNSRQVHIGIGPDSCEAPQPFKAVRIY